MTTPTPWRRRLLFSVVAALLALIVTESATRLLYRVAYGEGYSHLALLRLSPDEDPAVLRSIEAGSLPRYSRYDVLHPYVGFVRDVSIERSGSHGFTNLFEPIRRREPGKLIVAVVGGSVAEQLALYLEEVLEAELAGSSEPIVLNFAMGGFKQPQQLMVLSYMMSLGAQFDLIVNVDGFNELALSIDENHRNGIYPFFPRAWGSRVALEKSSKSFVIAGKIRYLRDRQQRLNEGIVSSPFRHSALYGVVQRFRATRLTAEIQRSFLDLLQLREAAFDFERDGPRIGWNEEQLLSAIADNWRASSVLMARLAESNGSEYYHFLQPNQYLSGSKPLTQEERRLADFPRPAYARIISAGYPLLKERAAGFPGQGVRFTDATLLFVDQQVTIYRDACCHYNEVGNRLFATFVLERIRRSTGHSELRNSIR